MVRSEREAKTEAVPLTLGLFAAFNRNSNLTINKFQWIVLIQYSVFIWEWLATGQTWHVSDIMSLIRWILWAKAGQWDRRVTLNAGLGLKWDWISTILCRVKQQEHCSKFINHDWSEFVSLCLYCQHRSAAGTCLCPGTRLVPWPHVAPGSGNERPGRLNIIRRKTLIRTLLTKNYEISEQVSGSNNTHHSLLNCSARKSQRYFINMYININCVSFFNFFLQIII